MTRLHTTHSRDSNRNESSEREGRQFHCEDDFDASKSIEGAENLLSRVVVTSLGTQ